MLSATLNLTYREDYWDSVELKKEFMRFLMRIHGLDLSLWDEMGYWDHRYRPFSFFDGDRLVSNVCLYSMDMTVQGKRCKVAQISAVGTLPEYRRKGLSQELTQKAIDWARGNHEFFYLFADEEAFGFYEKCGFRSVVEHKARVTVSGKKGKAGALKMDVQRKEHLEQIYRLACEREPVSDVLGVMNEKLFMFWCLYSLRDCVYHIPDLDVLVLFKRENGLVTIFDIVGKTVPEFSRIYPYICDERDEAVEFIFMVDKLKVGNCNMIRVEENGTHVMGDFPPEGGLSLFLL